MKNKFAVLIFLSLTFFFVEEAKSQIDAANPVKELRIQENDVLVGTYDSIGGEIVITNLSSIEGDEFIYNKLIYTVNSIKIIHTNGNKFNLTFNSICTKINDSNNYYLKVGISLYVADGRDKPNRNYVNCPPETHSCTRDTCSGCILATNYQGCFMGCFNDIKTSNKCTICNHAVSVGVSTFFGDYLKKVCDNPEL